MIEFAHNETPKRIIHSPDIKISPRFSYKQLKESRKNKEFKDEPILRKPLKAVSKEIYNYVTQFLSLPAFKLVKDSKNITIEEHILISDICQFIMHYNYEVTFYEALGDKNKNTYEGIKHDRKYIARVFKLLKKSIVTVEDAILYLLFKDTADECLSKQTKRAHSRKCGSWHVLEYIHNHTHIKFKAGKKLIAKQEKFLIYFFRMVDELVTKDLNIKPFTEEKKDVRNWAGYRPSDKRINFLNLMKSETSEDLLKALYAVVD